MTDNVHAEAQRLSVLDVCTMLGVPDEDRNLFVRWANELPDEKVRDALDSYVDVMIADRCWHSTDDLLSRLIKAGVDGLDMTVDELRLAVATLLALAARAEGTTPRT